MLSPTLLPLALLALATGCKADAVHAQPGDTVVVNPEAITIVMGPDGASPSEDQPFYSVDGTGKLFFLDFFVADEDLRPRNDVEIEITSLFEGLAVIPSEAVRTVDPPELPDGIESRSDIEEACTDDDGNFTNDEAWCAYAYDVDGGQFLDFGSNYAFSEGYVPTYAKMATDRNGTARAYLFLDWIPSDAKGYAAGETQVIGTIGYSAAAFIMTIESESE